jgi:hypothetical protein
MKNKFNEFQHLGKYHLSKNQLNGAQVGCHEDGNSRLDMPGGKAM